MVITRKMKPVVTCCWSFEESFGPDVLVLVLVSIGLESCQERVCSINRLNETQLTWLRT
jgi:hypothetical protein